METATTTTTNTTEDKGGNKSREQREGNPESMVSITADANSSHNESNEKKGPTIKDISGFDRKVIFVNRPGPACKTKRKVEQISQAEDGSGPSTSGEKRPFSPGVAEEKAKRRIINVVDSGEDTETMLEKSGDEEGSESAFARNPPAPADNKKRGRGRPPTSGQYVGLAKAKAMLLEQEQKELQALAERELLEQKATRRETRLLLAQSLKNLGEEHNSDEEEGEQPRRKILLQEAMDSAQTVLDIARKSANLKGTMVKLLKKAAENVIAGSKELASLSADSEVKALERENKRLREKITHMEEEVEALKKEMANFRLLNNQTGVPTPVPDPREDRPSAPSALAESSGRDSASKLLRNRSEKKGLRKGKMDTTLHKASPKFSSPPFLEGQGDAMEIEEGDRANNSPEPTTTATRALELETMRGSIIRQIGNMMAARFAAIETRLLPEKTLRPPLQADKKSEGKKAALETGGPTNRPSAEERSGKEKRTEKIGKESHSREALRTPAKTKEGTSTRATPLVSTISQSYAEAAKKGKKVLQGV